MREDHSAVCAAYMLLPDKKDDTYLRAIRALVREAHLENAGPTTIMADFEGGPVKAWRTVFPAARMRGCLFHYCQALWRNIALKGLTVQYRENKKAKVLLRCFGAMAFVHPNDVLEAFDTIVTALRTCVTNGEIDAMFDYAIQRFCDYVRDNYVRRLDRQGRWQAPRVADVGQWNCHYATLQGFHRTNNSIEAWNRQFAELFARSHCAMDKFIYRMQTDEDRSRQALLRLQLHPNEPLRRGRRPQYVAADATLRELVERYGEYRGNCRLLDFMRTVQYHLSSARFPGEEPANGDPDVAGNANAAAPPAPALPDVHGPPQGEPQPQRALPPPRHAQPAAPVPDRAEAAEPAPGGAQPAAPLPRRAQAPMRPRIAPPDPPLRAVAPPQAQPAALHVPATPRYAEALARRAPDAAAVPFELPRRFSVEVRRSSNVQPATVQGSRVVAVQQPGPSHAATSLGALAAAAAMRRDVLSAVNQDNAGATAGPSNSRKQAAGVAPLVAPSKNKAVRREAAQEDDHQEEDVQLPSQLSQKTASAQTLRVISASVPVVGRRAGRGSRTAGRSS